LETAPTLAKSSFGFAQDKPFGFAQDKPFGFAQDKPCGDWIWPAKAGPAKAGYRIAS
jgi:hypothetical protein